MSLRFSEEEFADLISGRGKGNREKSFVKKPEITPSKILSQYPLHLIAAEWLAFFMFKVSESDPIFISLSLGVKQLGLLANRTAENPKSIPWERIEQNIVLLWLQVNHPDVFEVSTATPMGGYRPNGSGGQMKGEGASLGYPDLILDFPSQGFHGLRIEMKRYEETAGIRPDQEKWLTNLAKLNYRSVVCYGHESAISVISRYLGKKDPVERKLPSWTLKDFNQLIQATTK